MLDLAPILISTPSRRGGSTLLQRLLCSGENGLIYGEGCANELQIAVQFYYLKHSQFGGQQSERSRQLEAVLAGATNDWIPYLTPPAEDWFKVLTEGLFLPIRYLQDFATEQGRPVWGVKYPEWSPLIIRQIMQLLPASKLVYLFRNPEDCLRSARSIGMVKTPEDEQLFVQTANMHAQQARQLLDPKRILFLDFEPLTETPQKYLEQLEAFTGIHSLQIDVFQHRINDYDRYIRPT